MVINGRTNQEQIAGLIFGIITKSGIVSIVNRETICSTFIHRWNMFYGYKEFVWSWLDKNHWHSGKLKNCISAWTLKDKISSCSCFCCASLNLFLWSPLGVFQAVLMLMETAQRLRFRFFSNHFSLVGMVIDCHYAGDHRHPLGEWLTTH